MDIRKTNIVRPSLIPNIAVIGSLKPSLPKDLKSAWPDHKHVSSVSWGREIYFMPRLPEILQDLKIEMKEKILHVVVFKNEYSLFGCNFNFRDLPVSDKYCAVFIHQLSGSIADRCINDQEKPSIQLLANKIYFHLYKNGYLIFRDFARNTMKFRNCLQKIGIEPVSDRIVLDGMISDHDVIHIFQKI